MSDPKGPKSARRRPEPPVDERGEKSALFSDLFRRAFALGLSGIFTTEEAFRRALSDTLPRDWVDFAVDQSERTRTEFTSRMAEEMGRVIESMDLEAMLHRLLAEHTLEVRAEVQLVPREAGSGEPGERSKGGVRVKVVGGRRAK